MENIKTFIFTYQTIGIFFRSMFKYDDFYGVSSAEYNKISKSIIFKILNFFRIRKYDKLIKENPYEDYMFIYRFLQLPFTFKKEKYSRLTININDIDFISQKQLSDNNILILINLKSKSTFKTKSSKFLDLY